MKTISLSRKQRKNLIRIAVSLAAFLIVLILDKTVGLAETAGGSLGWLLPFALYFGIYLLIGYDVLLKAARNIVRGRVLDENFLMTVATFGAFALGIYTGVTGNPIEGFDEACAVLLFYQVGEFFQSYATGKSRKSISALMDIRPDYANVIKDGAASVCDPSEVAAGDTILVNPGEKVPLDGIVLKGKSVLDTKALTGESLPREVSEGDEVISGSVNLSSQLEVRVEKAFYDSTVSKILELVENASGRKSKAENFITKFSAFYTPTVVLAALILAVIPSAITGAWDVWIYRALSFLVVSCPCALVVSVPLGFFAGIGAASRHGILVKGANYLEKLSKADVFVFDKTGTLTKGNFAVTEVVPVEKRDEILKLAATAERNSAHPIARSIVEKYGGETDGGYTLTDVSGKGIVAEKDGSVILCGNEKLMEDYGVNFVSGSRAGTVVYVAENGEFVGSILITDEIKPEAAETVAALNSMNSRTVMLTGDNEQTAAVVAAELGIGGYKASLLPQNKVEIVEELLSDKNPRSALCFIGDGINDAPVIMRADIGIAMGGVGSDAAIEASDVVLMKDDLKGIPTAKRIAKQTMRVVFENIIFSIAVKVAIMILAALGLASMWIAVVGDVGVAILAILNSMRVNRT